MGSNWFTTDTRYPELVTVVRDGDAVLIAKWISP